MTLRYVLTVILLNTAAVLVQAQDPKPAPQTSPPDSNVELTRLNTEIVQLYRAGKYEEALPLAQKALAVAEQTTGPESRFVADAWLNLAEIQAARKDFEGAEKAYQKALAVYQKVPRLDTQKVPRVLDRLATAFYERQNFSAAESSFQQSLNLREKSFGPESKEVVVSLLNLANLHFLTVKYGKSIPYFQRAVDIQKKLLSITHPDLAQALAGYSCALGKDGQAQKAEKELRLYWETLKPLLASPIKGDEPEALNRHALELAPPAYPAIAKAARAQGKVLIQTLLNDKGQVIQTCVISGHPLLKPAAEFATRRSTFKPIMVDGKPIMVVGIVKYNFVAQ